MKIAIDIPDIVWEKAKEYGHLDICGIELSEKVMNGTPLPKGHGRLIDEQQIIDRFKPIERFKYWCVGLDGLFNILRYTPTIIEADKAESEE